MVKLGSLTNFQIENALKPIVKDFQGVYSKNRLPKTLKNGFYVINLEDDTAGNGTHWTTLYINKPYAFYYDSFGYFPPKQVIEKTRDLDLHYNHFCLQNINSQACGFFACDFVLKVASGMKPDKIENDFITDEHWLKKNDRILQENPIIKNLIQLKIL